MKFVPKIKQEKKNQSLESEDFTEERIQFEKAKKEKKKMKIYEME